MKTLTKTCLDAMAKLLPEIDEDAQRCIVGGTGSYSEVTGCTQAAPTGYTFEQMDSMCIDGSWTGGYVDGYGYYGPVTVVTGFRVTGSMPTGSVFPEWLENSAQWVMEHMEVNIGAEGAITYGLQIAGEVKNGIGGSISPRYVVLAEGAASSTDGASIGFAEKEGMDFGMYYYVGGSYSSETANGNTSHTISAGGIGIGVSYTWDDAGNKKAFVGMNIGGKIAYIFGIEGELKAGVDINF